ncbi:Undecaprenyl-phosphate mannosyltransferase [Novipirellula aureliae]|uniref:Undecaprenyl-phosphate mannosyltransferase n=1 Tax=Novipirellula aureliae TaxID=2527966 RepID=A0A5C6DYW4_9BACT|nr:polyprenol monophosphomannose synthase [Novipirellula aureliae]TWU41424.1 Undecaprenyl-phosphate mannosyltransferase [Novipirellula aureliae]
MNASSSAPSSMPLERDLNGQEESGENLSAADLGSAKVLVGVCTFNEVANIVTVVERIRSALPGADILVVDDNSPDGTANVVRQRFSNLNSVQVEVRENERGLGSAILRAVNHAIEGDYDFFINLDADLSHDPTDLPSMLGLSISSPEVDVVIGSRYVSGGQIIGWPWQRRLMSRMVNRFATLCLRLPVRDCSGSMRCYRVAALKQIDQSRLRSEGYSLLEELLVEFNRDNAVMKELPITFTDREEGESKLTMTEAFRSIGQMVRLSFSCLVKTRQTQKYR